MLHSFFRGTQNNEALKFSERRRKMLSVNKINKKLLFILFLTVFLFLGFNLNIDAASAAETTSTTFNITVPYALPVSVAADGTVTTANNLEIKNAGTNAVKISEVKVEAQNGWELSDYGKDYSKTAVGRKEFGISIRGTSAAADGNIDTAKFQDILSENKALAITYDVTLPAQSEKISDTIANVVFVVEEIYEFDIDDNGAITGFSEYGLELYNGGKTEFVIPDTIKGITVTSIIDGNKYGTNTSGGAFSQKKNIIKITLPETIVRIGHKAFAACSSLKEINFPNSLSSIGNHAFDGCSGFTGELKLPNNITTIGSGAFNNCSGFTGKLIIPNSITEIESNTFRYCKKISGVIFPDGLTNISEWAFANCDALTGDIVIPSSVISVGNCAFYWDSNLQSVDLSTTNIESIESSTFFKCAKLISVKLPDTVKTIGNSAFENAGLVGELHLPNNLISIGRNAFNGCTGLTGSLIIPDGVTSIGNNAFMGCTKLTSATLPKEFTEIVSEGGTAFGLFYNDTKITDIYCNWYQGEKANIEAEAPWGATKATVHYLNNAAEAILEDELVLDELVPDEVISDAFTATDSAIENEVDNIVDIVDEDTPLSGMPDIVADVTKTPAVSVDESENNKDILTDITDGEANTVDKETTIIETSDNLKGENNNDQNSEKDDNTDNMLPDMIIKNGESEENREE